MIRIPDNLNLIDMVLTHATQVTLDEVLQINFDLFVASSGFEERATHFFSNVKFVKPPANKFVLAFSDRAILKNDRNLSEFSAIGFQLIQSFENARNNVAEILDKSFKDVKQNKINILIDYSCMTKVWYGTFLKIVEGFQNSTVESIDIYFTYTEAAYEDPLESEPNYSASFLPGFNSLDTPNKEVALIIGLGYEENRALGLIEFLHLDFESCYVFKTNKTSNPEFYDVINTSNNNLLKILPQDHIFEYPLNDLGYTDAILSTLVNHLISENKRVIIAPIGPKPFSLLALLLAVKYPSISIYRITQLPKEKPSVRFADKRKAPIICKAVFENKKTEP